MAWDISKVRNIGISAHIDSGKTTTSERILFYCNKIHAIHEVRGKDGVGAVMDNMELERERGITIQSAATQVQWKDYTINLIDTPGHVDFTVEVERSLRVLDGAIMILCAVAGVQSQSITVDRQLKRYHVPRVAFVNKCDRQGANPLRVRLQLREKLGLNAYMMELPIGLEDKLEGVVDLVGMKAIYFDGPNGEDLRIAEIPANLKDDAEKYREELLDAASMFDDSLMEDIMEKGYDGVEEEKVIAAIRKGTLAEQFVGVFCGSAHVNKGIQPLLDAVLRYLPAPNEVRNVALDLDNNEAEVELESVDNKPCVALGFKLDDGQYGQLTYTRVYQGKIKKGEELYNTRTKKKFKVGRLVRMNSAQMEDINEGCAGDIVALFGVDCASGDTFVSGGVNYSMASMYVPEPVISLSITPKDKQASMQMSKALNRFTKEDPTFRVYTDPESNETIIKGMGELHLEVYVERMRREYNCEVTTGAPQVAYRETISAEAEVQGKFVRQSGGHGQYGDVWTRFKPNPGKGFEFEDQTVGGSIPKEFIKPTQLGLEEALPNGLVAGYPVVDIRAELFDGSYHDVDSSEQAYKIAASLALKEAAKKCAPKILEPIMAVDITAPSEYLGAVMGDVTKRRGQIREQEETGNAIKVKAYVPLAEMFGYVTDLRGFTQGRGIFVMQMDHYEEVPKSIAKEIIEKNAARSAN